jgi:putative spermidine/putrescine transport system permease protein
MNLSRRVRVFFAACMAAGLAFIYGPLAVVVTNSFNASTTLQWPPRSFTLTWWSKMASNDGVRSAVVTSVLVALVATAVALVLGSLAAAAITRYEFFGRNTVSLLFVLPIALPGIVTGIALNNVFTSWFGGLTFFTVILGHATFCIVVVFNNVAARYRRLGHNLIEASLDLGASRFETFRNVTFPLIRSALVAGALLAFGLSFDEIIVTTFTAGPGQTTLPIWIYQNLFRPNQAPIVNAVAAALIAVSIVPIYLAQRLSQVHTGLSD